MATRKVIKGVLGNFLRTYISRYSEYDGYWLFGFLVRDLEELQIDLLTPTVSKPDSPLGVAVQSAGAKFADQLRKAGLARPQVQQACLTMRKLAGSVRGSVNGHPCDGYNVAFSVAVVTDGGRRYEREQVVFAAPHNAQVEIRSARRDNNMGKITLGFVGVLLGGMMGVLIGVPVTDALFGPGQEFGPMHRLLALFVGAPIGGLVGGILAVILGARFETKSLTARVE